jgi:hypothetical protein
MNLGNMAALTMKGRSEGERNNMRRRRGAKIERRKEEKKIIEKTHSG